MIARLLVGAALATPFLLSTGVLALAYRRANARWRAAARDATAATLRADSWRDFAGEQSRDLVALRWELRNAEVSVDVAVTRNDWLAARNAALVRCCDALRIQNVELTDAFRAIFPAANGALREHIEWALCLGAMAPETFIPTQRTGDES